MASGEGRPVLLITGGSRGIGAATARLAAAAGYAVAVNYQTGRAAAEAVVGEIEADGGVAMAIAGDVADERDVAALFSKAERTLGPLAALVNSAGIDGPESSLADADAETLSRVMQVNIVGTMLCCREAVRHMTAGHGGPIGSHGGGPGGVIVNLSSMAATTGGRTGRTAYAASKAAIDTFTMGLAKEVAKDGIRVNAVRPGMTYTDMTSYLRHDEGRHSEIADTIPMGRIAEPEEVARPILWLLSDAASFVTGACLDVSGGGFVIGRP